MPGPIEKPVRWRFGYVVNKSRRDFIKNIGLGAATIALPLWTTSCSEKKTPPNILFIAVDDLNDWANCLGGRPGVHTPHLDCLAKRGVLFTNAHCAAPACNPSRLHVRRMGMGGLHLPIPILSPKLIMNYLVSYTPSN